MHYVYEVKRNCTFFYFRETTVSDVSPPNSPSASRKDNVFNRLTSGSFRLNKPGR